MGQKQKEKKNRTNGCMNGYNLVEDKVQTCRAHTEKTRLRNPLEALPMYKHCPNILFVKIPIDWLKILGGNLRIQKERMNEYRAKARTIEI